MYLQLHIFVVIISTFELIFNPEIWRFRNVSK